MKIAAAAYPIEWHNRWNEYVGKLRVWVRTAAENGAELLVFPEYAAMEVASLAREEIAADLERSIDAVSARIKDVNELHSSLAREFNVHICAASGPVRREDGKPVNRARLFAPDGSNGAQDKLMMARFEREKWNISRGDAVKVFDTALGRIGLLIGYDSEFPLIARAMTEAGAEILVVTSCAPSLQGYRRIRVAAMARALENQCIVVHSTTVGDAKWLVTARQSIGTAAIFGPPDLGFPEEGIIATGKMNVAGWVYGETTLEAVREVRANGMVSNFNDWHDLDGQLGAVEVEKLGESVPA
jgi:predicted amidohydrolase